MAVGKGSMARASKAADNTSVPKETKRTTAKTSPACDRLPLFFRNFKRSDADDRVSEIRSGIGS